MDNYRLRRHTLGRIESEQLLQLLALYKKGGELFGNSEAFNQWLNQPAFGTGGLIPFDLLYTPGGINLVMEELLRIEYGALARSPTASWARPLTALGPRRAPEQPWRFMRYPPAPGRWPTRGISPLHGLSGYRWQMVARL